MSLKTLVIVLLALCLPAIAAWNWPTTPPSTWSEADQLDVCHQIHSALVERCQIVGVTTPTNIETYTVAAGYSNTVYTNDGVVWTSRTHLTKSVTVTNAYTPFEYTYTDPQGTFTATGFPTLTRNMLASFATKIETLLPKFVDTNIFGDGGLYFTNRVYATNWAGLASVGAPMLTKQAIIDATGGVFVAGSTNAWGITNSVTAYWWYADDQPSTNVILYIGGRSNQWATQFSTTLAHSNPPGVIVWGFTNVNASARYYWASGSPTTVTMRISGTRVWNTNTISNATADLTFDADQPYTLTGLWRTITAATNIAGTAASNDWIIVSYPTNLYFVQTTSTNFAQRAYWRPFGAFRSCIDRMLWTTNYHTISGWTNNWEGEASVPFSSAVGTCQTNCNADYSYGYVYGSGRHTWQAASVWLANRLYSAPYYTDGRQCVKVAGERLFGSVTLSTNLAKEAVWFAAVGKASDAVSLPDVSNHYFNAFGTPWQEYRFIQGWSTNLTATDTGVYPYGTNRPIEGTTCVTNIGPSVPWEVIGLTNNADTGFAFWPSGLWVLKWDFTYR